MIIRYPKVPYIFFIKPQLSEFKNEYKKKLCRIPVSEYFSDAKPKHPATYFYITKEQALPEVMHHE